MPFQLEPYHRNTADAELIEDLRRVAAKTAASSVTIDVYNEHGRFHATTLTRRFGSWFKALELAGLRKTRNLNIPNEALFENLVEVWTKLGRQPKYDDLTKEVSSYSSGTYEKRFGGWRRALEAFVAWANEETTPPTNLTNERVGRRTPRHVNWRQRAIILMRDGARCRLCGADPPSGARLHIDHIVPWSRGGETVVENLQILCEQCNIGKSNVAPPA
ncbi:MAG TPA: HNH endonuclease [Stellaceae bacterium]|nr:HNH endonuclease [Stellaceae bacterium]